MAGSRPTAWVGQFPLAWERERVVVSFRVLPNVRHVKGNRHYLELLADFDRKSALLRGFYAVSSTAIASIRHEK